MTLEGTATCLTGCILAEAKPVTVLQIALPALEISWANPEEAEGDKEVIEFGDCGVWLFELLEYALYFLPFMETSNLGFPDDSF